MVKFVLTLLAVGSLALVGTAPSSAQVRPDSAHPVRPDSAQPVRPDSAQPVRPDSAQPARAASAREAAITKCLEQTMAQTPPGSSSGFRAEAYRACMAKEKQRP